MAKGFSRKRSTRAGSSLRSFLDPAECPDENRFFALPFSPRPSALRRHKRPCVWAFFPTSLMRRLWWPRISAPKARDGLSNVSARDTKIEWFIYNAGPSAMEAIFARSIDFTYVGPSPAVNAYARAKGRGMKIVAGAMRGGEALVVRGDTIRKVEDFRGKVDRHATTGQHAGCRVQGLADQQWNSCHIGRRRCARAPNRKPGHTGSLPARKA